MLVMSLDLAVNMGFCIGPAGGKPRAGSYRLKRPDDPSQRACKKLGIWLRDQLMLEKPDIIVVEAPVNIGGLVDWKDAKPGERPKFKSNPETISLLHRLLGGVETICGPYGIRCETGNVQTVRKHFVGMARPEDPKKVVLQRCKLLGYLASDSVDHNAGDACALWDWACAHYCRAPQPLVMFEQGKR